MNIKITLGYKSFIMKDVNAKMVDDLMKAIVTDYSYIHGNRHDYILNEFLQIDIISSKQIPDIDYDQFLSMKDEIENGNQDTVES